MVHREVQIMGMQRTDSRAQLGLLQQHIPGGKLLFTSSQASTCNPLPYPASQRYHPWKGRCCLDHFKQAGTKTSKSSASTCQSAALPLKGPAVQRKERRGGRSCLEALCLTLLISSSTPGRALMSRATPRRALQAASAGAVLRCSAGLEAGPPAAAVAREKLPLVRSRSRDPRLEVPARMAACRGPDRGFSWGQRG